MSLRADASIIAGGKNILHTFREHPKRSVVILNCPEDYHVVQNTDRSHAKGNITLVYTGGIRRGRSL